MADWLRYHVSTLQAADRYVISVQHWTSFFDRERKAGRLPTAITVRQLTPQLQARFRDWRRADGVGGHTVSRDLAALRGALTWGWKNQRIEHPPFIADVPAHEKAPARDRVLSMDEVAALMDACADRDDREHVLRFIVIELGTAGRPEAVLELTSGNIDLRRGLIDPRQPGRLHPRKSRAVVPIAAAVLPWVSGMEGKIIAYRVPIAERNRTPGGPTHLVRETRCIKTAWKAICKDAGVTGATPKTLRHTMLTWLAERGVPKEQRMTLAGHSAQDTTAKNYEHLSPQYLRAAVAEIDAYFDVLADLTTAHLRYKNDTGSIEPLAA
ncbi:MAG: site-specific integrase [Pseudomonadota bacterium]|nr:site-specific integrase [Pseudomonadota bacterium]